MKPFDNKGHQLLLGSCQKAPSVRVSLVALGVLAKHWRCIPRGVGREGVLVAVGAVLVVNIGGEPVSHEDYIAIIGRALGVEPKLAWNPNLNPSPRADLTRMKQLMGAPRVPVEEGIRLVLEANFPERLRR